LYHAGLTAEGKSSCFRGDSLLDTLATWKLLYAAGSGLLLFGYSMDTAKRDVAARAFVTASGAVYGGVHGPPPIDLDSVQSIADYADPVVQKKYVHMYFAKYVTLWRLVRQRVHVDPKADLYSIGAGPCLDLFGWFWDVGPSTGAVRGVDAQSWSEIHGMKEWKRLVQILVPRLSFQSKYVVPAPGSVRQASGLRGAKAYPSSNISNRGTVLFPFCLNHCFGVKDSTAWEGRKLLGAWIDDVRARGARVVIADMHQQKSTKPFWDGVRQTLGVNDLPVNLEFESEIRELAPLYEEEWHRRCSHHMAKATVLVLDAKGARFLK
jgi:hypothetical protein